MQIDPWWKAEACVSEVLQQMNLTKLPIDPFKIAEAKNIMHQENPSLGAGISGCLMRIGHTFGIIYSTRFASNGFKRFTVGHELGHYFLEGHADYLFQDGKTLHTSTSGFISEDRYEREADAFAASLLMPKHLFRPACANTGIGLDAIKAMASICDTSLTATSIRFARLSPDPVAVILSMNQKVLFSIMSPCFRTQRTLTWIKRGAGIPPESLTFHFTRDLTNVQNARTASGGTTLAEWFDGPETHINEDVIGLGEYGRTLTVLWTDELPDPDEGTTRADGRQDDEVESLLPSQRFFQKTRY
jgi:hypothetical protein